MVGGVNTEQKGVTISVTVVRYALQLQPSREHSMAGVLMAQRAATNANHPGTRNASCSLYIYIYMRVEKNRRRENTLDLTRPQPVWFWVVLLLSLASASTPHTHLTPPTSDVAIGARINAYACTRLRVAVRLRCILDHDS